MKQSLLMKQAFASLMLALSVSPWASAADSSPALFGAIEIGSRFEVGQALSIALDDEDYEEDCIRGELRFQNGTLVSDTDVRAPHCRLTVRVDSDSATSRSTTLTARQTLTVFSTHLRSYTSGKEIWVSFDRETSALPAYDLLCTFPGKQKKAVTQADLKAVLGSALKAIP